MNQPFLNKLISLITIFLALHYCFSYLLLANLFNQLNLNGFTILSLEDVLFPCIGINKDLFLSFGMSFMIVILCEMLEFVRPGCVRFTKLEGKENGIIMYIVFFALLVLGVLLLYPYSIEKYGIVLMLLLLLSLPYFSYIKRVKRVILLSLGVLTMMTMMGSISDSFRPENEIAGDDDLSNIVVEMKEQTIVSDTNRSLVFVGARYVIFYNRKQEEAELYPVAEVKAIRYRSGKRAGIAFKSL